MKRTYQPSKRKRQTTCGFRGMKTEDGRNLEPETTQRTQALVRVNKKFPKSARVLHRSHFLSLLKRGRHFSCDEVRVE